MNYIKLQKQFLDTFSKKGSKFICCILDEHYLISDNRFQIFKIPKSEMWLDIKKVMEGRTEVPSLESYMKLEGENGVLTGDIKETPDKKTIIKVASENNSSWIDKKLLDRFEIKKGLHFTITDKKTNPLLVWENDVLCGMILPVRVKEGD